MGGVLQGRIPIGYAVSILMIVYRDAHRGCAVFLQNGALNARLPPRGTFAHESRLPSR